MFSRRNKLLSALYQEPRSALISCHQMIPAFNAIKMVKVEITVGYNIQKDQDYCISDILKTKSGEDSSKLGARYCCILSVNI